MSKERADLEQRAFCKCGHPQDDHMPFSTDCVYTQSGCSCAGFALAYPDAAPSSPAPTPDASLREDLSVSRLRCMIEDLRASSPMDCKCGGIPKAYALRVARVLEALLARHPAATAEHGVCANSRDCIRCGERIAPSFGVCFKCHTDAPVPAPSLAPHDAGEVSALVARLRSATICAHSQCNAFAPKLCAEAADELLRQAARITDLEAQVQRVREEAATMIATPIPGPQASAIAVGRVMQRRNDGDELLAALQSAPSQPPPVLSALRELAAHGRACYAAYLVACKAESDAYDTTPEMRRARAYWSGECANALNKLADAALAAEHERGQATKAAERE